MAGSAVSAAGRNRARWRPGWDPEQRKLTPAYILEPVRAAMGGRIGLDPCTEPDNPTRAERYYALPRNGLAHPWRRGPIWCNPPWGAAAAPWILRCIEAGQAGIPTVLLIPAYMDTERVHSVLRGADAVTFVGGRIGFGTLKEDGREFTMTEGALLAAWGVDLAGTGLGTTMRRVPAGDPALGL